MLKTEHDKGDSVILLKDQLYYFHHKQVLRPVWDYGIQLWGCTSLAKLLVKQ
jgi:hypothetical protein